MLRSAWAFAAFCVSTGVLLSAGPVEFGKSELNGALAARGLRSSISFIAELAAPSPS